MVLTELDPHADHPPVPAPVARPRHVVLLVLGVLLAGVGLAFTGLAATVGTGLLQQGRQGYIESPSERYAVDTYAITSQRLDVVLDEGLPSAGRAGPVASFSLRATPAVPGRRSSSGSDHRPTSTGTSPTWQHSELTQVRFNPFQADYPSVAGSVAPARPADQDFWAASAQGSGTQQIESDLHSGSWAVVIMNADGSQAGRRRPAGRCAVLVPGSGHLGITRPRRRAPGRRHPAGGVGPASGPAGQRSLLDPDRPASPQVRTPGHLPSAPERHLDPVLSRWLWLVKWFLAIPHYLVLAVLWFALVVTTVVAGFAILFTGRYPRSLFDFNVGVIRWSWRVGFYAYSALGTDRYPPFTLASHRLPRRLRRRLPDAPLARPGAGQVLAAGDPAPDHRRGAHRQPCATGGPPGSDWTSGSPSTSGVSLLGLLVLVGGFFLLVTRHYPRPLFDFILGINRWVYRVITYVALMRDEYPPFHLDQGELDPGTAVPGGSTDRPAEVLT